MNKSPNQDEQNQDEHEDYTLIAESEDEKEQEGETFTDASSEVAAAVAADGAVFPEISTAKPKGRKRTYLSIRFKVGGSFAVLLAMTIVIGLVGVIRLFALQSQVDTLARTNLEIVEQSNSLEEDLLTMESSMRGYLITGNTALLSDNYDSVKSVYPKEFSSLQKLLQGNKDDLSTLSAIKQSFNQYVQYSDQMIQLRKSGQQKIAIQDESQQAGDAASQGADSGLQLIVQEYQTEAAQNASKLRTTVNDTIIVMAILTAISILIGIIFGLPATMSTPRNINRVTRILREIASAGGDLTKRIEGVKSRDEVQRLADATNELLASIATLVGGIGHHSDTLAASAEQLTASSDETARAVNDIAATAGEFAQVSEQAVGALEELNEALVAIGSHSDETAAKADEVSTAITNVSTSTDRGQALVEQAEASMESMQTMTTRANTSVQDLNAASAQIAQILGTIRNIAEETNLLALNASIEAARAGDAGRGFAVVAQEVRHLAEQSREATKRINDIIGRNLELMSQVSAAMEQGVAAVNNGREAFSRTKDAFVDIHSAVERVVPSTTDIVERTRTQASLLQGGRAGVQKLNTLMAQVAAGSQNNAASTEETLATVEEIAASSHELARIAQALQDQVGRFQV
ncbi:methyl-accepting chemotaxis protein [Alicyclobacillus fodiniaquatilis]|uniref:Methyl-accepting chemotaxis protein n=1 Tax=Alicyclobacillus fodiniaquatilis TaxID=1661150 RepID=A0ABW4JP61_9BACL